MELKMACIFLRYFRFIL